MLTPVLILHVVAALIFLGPVTFAVSAFPKSALAAHNGEEHAAGRAQILHRVSSTYGMLSLLVPLLGVAVMFTEMSYWREGRFHASIALSVVAWIILLLLILPKQRKAMGALNLLDVADRDEDEDFSRLDWEKNTKLMNIFGGIFSLLWVIVAVLMVI